jgi:hypothetical protein
MNRFQIWRRLRFGQTKQVDDLLFNAEKALFDRWHVRLRLLSDSLRLGDSSSKFFFNGLKFETVESLDVFLGEVLKLGLASNTDS